MKTIIELNAAEVKTAINRYLEENLDLDIPLGDNLKITRVNLDENNLINTIEVYI